MAMKERLKNYGVITLGSLLFALGFDWLFAPNQVAMGGVTGLAQVVNALWPLLPVGTLTLVMNIPLFLAGWKLIGFHLLASSLFSMAVSSLAIDAIAALHTFAPVDPMLASLCGGAMLGVGLGLVFSRGATTGGTDIVARLLKLKFPWLPMGKLMLLPDGVVLLLAALAFGNVAAALYGGVALFVTSRVMDTVLYGLDTSKVAYIISDSWRTIADVLLREQGRGVTILRGEGAYTNREKQVLMVAFRQKDIVQIKHTVRDIDSGAFLIVCDAHEVLGEGFGDYQKEEI
ncbi:YitT family protein [Oscillibacter sp.]|uniref:YitT family protein n=1 Tax=Oscillibacter sp. TaxID=1945593 RepID=UPI00261A92F0|nr:YitT family protein [Oscillibacter sp.]MDD3346386.1 YitT family protein [Oscillibacter sp.]